VASLKEKLFLVKNNFALRKEISINVSKIIKELNWDKLNQTYLENFMTMLME